MAMASAAPPRPATTNQRLPNSPDRAMSRSRTSVRRLSLGRAVSTSVRPIDRGEDRAAPAVQSSTGT